MKLRVIPLAQSMPSCESAIVDLTGDGDNDDEETRALPYQSLVDGLATPRPGQGSRSRSRTPVARRRANLIQDELQRSVAGYQKMSCPPLNLSCQLMVVLHMISSVEEARPVMMM